MIRRIYIGFSALAVLIIAGITVAKSHSKTDPLNNIHQNIVTDYPDVKHIKRDALERQLSSNEYLIFDARPLVEYQISHIQGAVQIDPDISAEAFHAEFGRSLRSKKLIFYCSVGWRSTSLANRLQSTALNSGAISIHNMEGGLFGWHNDNRPLINATGSTTAIHPYNQYWGRLIENKNSIRSSSLP